MNRSFFSRTACMAAALLLLAACSSDDEGSGILDGDGSGGSSSGSYSIALTGPSCVEPGQTVDGFTAKLTTTSGAAARQVFVLLQPKVGGSCTTTAGTITGSIEATAPDGTTSSDGANTNSLGIVPFSYTAPSDTIRNAVNVTICATAKRNDANAGTAQRTIRLQPPSGEGLKVQGPAVGGVRGSSGSVSVDAGALLADLLITAENTAASCGTVGPIGGAAVTVTPKLTGAVVRLIDASTGIDGTAAFDYQAPTTVPSTGAQEELTVNVGGKTTVFKLTVNPPPPPAAIQVTVSGPNTASPNVTQSGYTALVEQVTTAGVRTPYSGARLSFLPDGVVTATTSSGTGVRNVTDANGVVPFTVKAPSTATAGQNLSLSAKVEPGTDAALVTGCDATKVTSPRCTDTFDLLIQQDVFRFTGPIYGEQGVVGEANAVPLALQWTTSSGTGVPGCVNLSASFSGGTSTPAELLKINGDNVPASQTRRVQLSSSGTLQVPVAVLSDSSGFVTVTATENRSCTSSTTASGPLSASTGVQFIDEICTTTLDGRNCVDLAAPLRALTSPDASGAQRTIPLTLTVLNNAYRPIDGAQVLFSIVTPARTGDANERVFPGGGTTNANGVANSVYYVPVVTFPAGTTSVPVQIRGCVRKFGAVAGDENGLVCSIRNIDIVQPTTP